MTFRWKDYRLNDDERYKTMSLDTPEFIRRFLIHVLPKGLHRIRHYGMFVNGQRRENLKKARTLLNVEPTLDTRDDAGDDDTPPPWLACPACGHTMRVIEFFLPPPQPRGRDPPCR